MTRAEVERVLALRPDLAAHLIQRLVQRVRTLTHTVSRLASVDVYGRLACSTRWRLMTAAGASCRAR